MHSFSILLLVKFVILDIKSFGSVMSMCLQIKVVGVVPVMVV